MLRFRSFSLIALLVLVLVSVGVVNAVPNGYEEIQERQAKNNSASTASATDSQAPADTAAPASSTIPAVGTTQTSLASQPLISGFFNSTAHPNTLPLTPTITPASAVAGVLLILTGVTLTSISIKYRTLQIFLSGLYLTSLCVTVLILYVVSLPVDNKTQGAYISAIVAPGFIVGFLATLFPDMTEGVGCIVGGFCAAMWLLVLKPGGLIKSTSGKSVLISLFCLLFLATSFSPYTKPFGLIGSLSFAGATAIVLGIDCFSRAGLKEFWAWIWNLNSNLFPLGASTYPITRGIRVEIAAIFVMFVAGVAAQMKLWAIIKKKRDEMRLKRTRDEELRDSEALDVGKEFEERARVERVRWEEAYGEKAPLRPASGPKTRSIADSAIAMDAKKTPPSTITSVRRMSSDYTIEMAEMDVTPVGNVRRHSGQSGHSVSLKPTSRKPTSMRPTSMRPTSMNPISMNPISMSPVPTNPATMNSNKQDGVVMSSKVIHVDEKIPTILEDTNNEGSQEKSDGGDKSDGDCRRSVSTVGASSERQEKHLSGVSALTSCPSPVSPLSPTSPAPPVPEITTKVPPLEAQDPVVDDKESRAATYSGDDIPSTRSHQRRSSKSSNLLKRLSRTAVVNSSRLPAGVEKPWSRSSNPAESSTERLSWVAGASIDDRRSSVAATVDEIGSDKDQLESLPPDMTAVRPISQIFGSPVQSRYEEKQPEQKAEKKLGRAASTSRVELGRTSAGDEKTPIEQDKKKTRPSSVCDIRQNVIIESPKQEVESKSKASSSQKQKASSSKSPALTEELLPSAAPSKVLTSFRTHEWAKHLSDAEIPEVEKLKLRNEFENGGEENDDEDSDHEIPAPLDILALQQTPLTGGVPPAAPLNNRSQPSSTRSSSHGEKLPSAPPQVHRNNSTQQGRWGGNSSSSSNVRQSIQRFEKGNMNVLVPPPIPNAAVSSSLSSTGVHRKPHRSVSATSLAPLYSHTPTTSNSSAGNNLISQRQTIMQQKRSYTSVGTQLTSTPELPPDSRSSTPPRRQSSENASVQSRGYLADSRKSSCENELSDDMSMKQRKAIIQQGKERETLMKGSGSSAPPLSSPNEYQNPQAPLRNFALRSQSKLSAQNQTPAQREAVMASWRAEVREDLEGLPSRQRSSSALVNGGGYGNGFGMGGGGNVAANQTGKITASQEREMDMRRMQLFEEKRREGCLAVLRKGEEERRNAQRDDIIRGGALDARSGIEGAHREVMRRLQRQASTNT